MLTPRHLTLTAAALLLATTAMAQQGPASGPPPPLPGAPVEENELVETWNDAAGGRPPGGHAFEAGDPAIDTWEKLPDMPTQRNHLAMAVVNGKVLVAGGRFGPGAMAERTDAVEIYDPGTRRWTKGAPLPAPRGGVTGAADAGCMVVFGGEGEGSHVLGLTPTAYGHHRRANRWARLSDLPIAVHGLKGGAVIGGRIFLPGGAITLGRNAGANAMQAYRPTMGCE